VHQAKGFSTKNEKAQIKKWYKLTSGIAAKFHKTTG
jgi:hypothetical protein